MHVNFRKQNRRINYQADKQIWRKIHWNDPFPRKRNKESENWELHRVKSLEKSP